MQWEQHRIHMLFFILIYFPGPFGGGGGIVQTQVIKFHPWSIYCMSKFCKQLVLVLIEDTLCLNVIMNFDRVCPYHSILAYMMKISLVQFVYFVNPLNISISAADI
jgi:hypothetical protein